MSADNYYLIRVHPHGGFCAVMGFASDNRTPRANAKDEQFATVTEAVIWAANEFSEYGVQVHPECDKAELGRIGAEDD